MTGASVGALAAMRALAHVICPLQAVARVDALRANLRAGSASASAIGFEAEAAVNYWLQSAVRLADKRHQGAEWAELAAPLPEEDDLAQRLCNLADGDPEEN